MAPLIRSPFSLKPITTTDIQTCARVAGQAFESDRHTQLKARSSNSPYDHEDGMRGGLSYWHSLPAGTVDMTMAVDNSTGEIVGWVVWRCHGFNSPSADAQREKELQQQLRDGDKEPISAKTKVQPLEQSHSSARARLEAHTSADMAAWMKRLMPPGTMCMYICSIVVHPAHQGRGVGAALIRKGTLRADAEGVFSWVHASEAGAHIFAKQGFEEVGRLELDLDYWNTESAVPPEGQAGEWGTYVFRYMSRRAGA